MKGRPLSGRGLSGRKLGGSGLGKARPGVGGGPSDYVPPDPPDPEYVPTYHYLGF
jgi:hypothetical protein